MARLEDKLPAYTVGSLQRLAQVESLPDFIKSISQDKNPAKKTWGSSKARQGCFQADPVRQTYAGKRFGQIGACSCAAI